MTTFSHLYPHFSIYMYVVLQLCHVCAPTWNFGESDRRCSRRELWRGRCLDLWCQVYNSILTIMHYQIHLESHHVTYFKWLLSFHRSGLTLLIVKNTISCVLLVAIPLFFSRLLGILVNYEVYLFRLNTVRLHELICVSTPFTELCYPKVFAYLLSTLLLNFSFELRRLKPGSWHLLETLVPVYTVWISLWLNPGPH